MNSEPTLAILLSRLALISQVVAQTLLVFERVLEDGVLGEGQSGRKGVLSPRRVDAEELRRVALKQDRELNKLLKAFPNSFATRLFAVVLMHWREIVTPNRARRPDVLAIATELAASPKHPHSIHVVRFGAVLAIRSLYGIAYNTDSLRALRASYVELVDRFSEQERRRIRKGSDSYEAFLIDVLAMGGSIHRSLSGGNLAAYYEGFIKHPFGVDVSDEGRARRTYGKGTPWPELHSSGELPSFPTTLNFSFGQPIGIQGFDEITRGILPALPMDKEPGPVGGGQVTLIAGPPGSGKTTLCLAMASRMAELGSSVRYITTEEESASLELKRAMTGSEGYLTRALFPEEDWSPSEDFQFIKGDAFNDLDAIVDTLREEVGQIRNSMDERRERQRSGQKELTIYLVFPRVLVVDSLTVLLHAVEHEREKARRNLGSMLRELRRLGIYVLLVGGPDDVRDQGLAYLVDNVFVLQTDDERTGQHPLRTLSVEKTRLQTSFRGRHVLHISRHHGCVVSPSMHSVIRSIHEKPEIEVDPSRVALVHQGSPGRMFKDALHISARSRVLIYGHGSSGKARFGMWLALQPRVPKEQLYSDLNREQVRHALRTKKVENTVERGVRVLVVSFLYGSSYYERIASECGAPRDLLVGSTVTVMNFYPGFIDPESFVARVRMQIAAAKLEGRPFTSVLLDGLHNVLLQYPLLEKEDLLWPALYRVLRTEGVETISTFTFFRAGEHLLRYDPALAADGAGTSLGVSQKVFFHLLVSSCDYTFTFERARSESPSDDVQICLSSSIDSVEGRETEFFWNPMRFASVGSARSK